VRPEIRVRAYVEKEHLSHLYVINGDAVANEKYHVRLWPMTCWINHRGDVVAVHFGYDKGDEQTLEREARDLMAAERPTAR
jgi:hypothetical protein